MAKGKKKKGKSSLMLFVIEIVVLMILVGGIFVYAKVNEGLRKIGTSSPHVSQNGEIDPNQDADAAGENEGVAEIESMHGYTNIALVGLDTRDSDQLDYANSDTMLIASINNDTKKVRLVSLYRDTLLNINPDGEDNQGGDGSELVSDEELVGTDYEDEEEEYNDDDYDDEDGDAYESDYDSEYNYEDDEEEESGEDDDSASDYSESLAETVTVGGTYDKANAAYNLGSAKQMLTMMNKNLDMDIHDYVVVNFKSLVTLIDDLGGLDVDMLHDEVVHTNNYAIETSKAVGAKYTKLKEPPDDGSVNTYHLNGVQSVSYARIRKTTGNDPKRTERQRVIIGKIVDKAKAQGINAVTAILNDVLPLCKTSLSNAEIIKLASSMMNYEIEKTSGFPFVHLDIDCYPHGRKRDAVVPVTLETNVIELHKFLFDDSSYEPTATVRQISADITKITDLSEASIASATEASAIPSIGGETDKLN